mgnify:FL=1
MFTKAQKILLNLFTVEEIENPATLKIVAEKMDEPEEDIFEHDCHLSAEDGCKVCDKLYENNQTTD